MVRTASTNAKLDALQSRTRQAELFVLVLWAVGAGAWLPPLEVVCRVASKSEYNFVRLSITHAAGAQYGLPHALMDWRADGELAYIYIANYIAIYLRS